MNNEKGAQALADIFAANVEQKRHWYSPAAEAYNAMRPKYPDEIVAFAVDAAGLTAASRLLEIGCGPGTATMAFASRGFSILAVEPNPDFCAIAQRNCAAYPDIRFRNCAFEELPIEPSSFDCVVAATSMHWVSADIAYVKAAEALTAGGHLVLLWNMVLRLSDEANQQFLPVYRSRVPDLPRPEADSPETQILQLNHSARIALDTGLFTDLQATSRVVDAVYSADEYLRLLTTYSQYIALEATTREELFAEIRAIIIEQFDGRLALTCRSACHVARKAPRRPL
jgi:SAM-dependent methyltransferase